MSCRSLVIAKITVTGLPGNPPYAEVDHDDNAKSFVVKVVTQNVGTVKVGETETELTLQSPEAGQIDVVDIYDHNAAPSTAHCRGQQTMDPWPTSHTRLTSKLYLSGQSRRLPFSGRSI